MLPSLRVILSFFIFFILTPPLLAQDNDSPLAVGRWYKLEINEDGVYRIGYEDLTKAGLDPAAINPLHLKILGNGGGMLPQPNSVIRPDGLQEVSILVRGEGDGQFNIGDYILFYAQGPDAYYYDSLHELHYERNIYSNENYYFLTIGSSPGKRIANVIDSGHEFPEINSYNNFLFYKEEKYNLLASGRVWYTDKFDFTTSLEYTFSFPSISPNSEIKVTSAVMAQSFAPSSFKLMLNGTPIGEQSIESVPDFRERIYRYSIKGHENLSKFLINAANVTSPELRLTVQYEKNNSGHSIGYLDYLLVEAISSLKLTNGQTIFRSLSSLENNFSTFHVEGVSDNTQIWDVSDHQHPKYQDFFKNGGIAKYGTNTSTLKHFVAFDPTEVDAVIPEPVSNQNLRSIASPDLLIICHKDFISEAKRLAAFRESHDQLSVATVTTEQIFNEFSSGKQDVVAIRDFVKFLYDQGGRLKYLLLFGRGSYDYKDITENNTNYVPIYESRNSLHPLETYASDDFYGFLEDHEGAWEEKPGGNHTLDIGVGRIPVTSISEAKDVVDKIVSYNTDRKALGAWRNDIVFVADDEDNNIHTKQADQLAEFVDTTFSLFNYRKLFLDSYPQKSSPSGQTAPKANDALDRWIEQGALLVNFTGHGGELGWMQEQVLTLFMIENWKNSHKLPLFITATCEFGRHDDPQRISGGERVVTNSSGGGIAILSTCRPVYSSSNFELNKAFYSEVFRRSNGEYPRLGDIIRETKNRSIDKTVDANQVGNRNFALLGDPSMRLNYPKQTVHISSLQNSTDLTDTLKAMSKMVILGDIINEMGEINESFNGYLHATVYDKESVLETLGDGGAPYAYKARENVIFRGVASIQEGKYQFEFVVPKNISYQSGRGKISLYAMDEKVNLDASGANIDIAIGGTAANPPKDTEGPEIQIFFGDTTYTGKAPVNNNTLLIVKLEDESGINISGYGLGNNLTALLDQEVTFILNDYYTASSDTYKEGWVTFPLNDLTPGKHSLTVTAWDTYNNFNEHTIEFMVSKQGELVISRLWNYPNPFISETTIMFEHNRAGDDLDVNLQILSLKGGVIKDINYFIPESTGQVRLMQWNGSENNYQKLPEGIYLYRVTVRSTTDGAKNHRYEKLIFIN